MKSSLWKVVGGVTPKELQEDPDKFGGMGHRMAAAIRMNLHYVDLEGPSSRVSLPVSEIDAQILISDGQVRVDECGFWSSVYDDNAVTFWFVSTEEKVPLLNRP